MSAIRQQQSMFLLFSWTVIVRKMKKKREATIDEEGGMEAARDGDSLEKSWRNASQVKRNENQFCYSPLANGNVRERGSHTLLIFTKRAF